MVHLNIFDIFLVPTSFLFGTEYLRRPVWPRYECCVCPGSSCGDSQILLSQFDPIQNSWTVNLTNRSVNSQNRLVNLQNYPYHPTSVGNGFACPTANGRTRPVSHPTFGPSCGCSSSKHTAHFPVTPQPNAQAVANSWAANDSTQDKLSDQPGTTQS